MTGRSGKEGRFTLRARSPLPGAPVYIAGNPPTGPMAAKRYPNLFTYYI